MTLSSLDPWLNQQQGLKDKLAGLSQPMKAIAWWAFLGVLDSGYSRATNEFTVGAPQGLNKKEAVAFLQENLGLKPPKVI